MGISKGAMEVLIEEMNTISYTYTAYFHDLGKLQEAGVLEEVRELVDVLLCGLLTM